MIAIKYCPVCAEDAFRPNQDKSYQCRQCDFLYFHNIATAVGGIIEVGDEVLLSVRNQDPQKHMLDLPGGFVNAEETAEDALIREIKEELSISIDGLRYLCSFPNKYLYRKVLYNTLDIFYIISLAEKPKIVVQDDVADIRWISKSQIPFDEIAFESIANCLRFYTKAT